MPIKQVSVVKVIRAVRCHALADVETEVIAIPVAKFRLPNYSSSMISEFKLLLEKIQQLADLSVSLRLENADLRRQAVSLQTDNAVLAGRMHEAHERVLAVMNALPQQNAAAIHLTESE